VTAYTLLALADDFRDFADGQLGLSEQKQKAQPRSVARRT
jgi:hypothetical protein